MLSDPDASSRQFSGDEPNTELAGRAPTTGHQPGQRAVEHLLVGEIASAHGLRGEVSIKVLSENSARFAPGRQLWVGRDPIGSRTVEVEATRSHSGRSVVKFAEVDDRNAAEALRGQLVFVESSGAPDLEEDAYWEYEVAGARVISVKGPELGVLSGIEERLEQDLWRVETPSGPVLVPASKDIIVSVDADRKLIVVDAPQGLFPNADDQKKSE